MYKKLKKKNKEKTKNKANKGLNAFGLETVK